MTSREATEAMPKQDRVATLRAALAGLSGQDRIRGRVELSHALLDRAWRAGLETSADRGDFDEAIAIMEEVHADPRLLDAFRGSITQRLGLLLAFRHLVTASGNEPDRKRAVELLTDSLDVTGLAPVTVTVARLMLSQLHLIAVSRGLASVSLAAMLQGGAAEYRAEVDLAIGYARQVAETPMVTADLSLMARMLIGTAEPIRSQIAMMDVATTGFDQRMTQQLLAAAQAFEARSGAADAAAGSPGASDPPDEPLVPPQVLGSLLRATFAGSPLDQPTTVVYGTEPATSPGPPQPTPAAVPVDVTPLRVALADQLAELVAAAQDVRSMPAENAGPAEDTGPAEAAAAGAARAVERPEAYRSAAALLRPDLPPLPIDAVDDCVALATSVVHEVAVTDPAAAGIDRFVLAAALFLRARGDEDTAPETDGTGHPGDADPTDTVRGDDGGGDLGVGLEGLLRAAGTLPPEHPAAPGLCTGLGAFLDDRQPLRGLSTPAARSFADWSAAVLAAHCGNAPDPATPAGAAARIAAPAEADRATIRAVGGLCRAAGALAAGSSQRTPTLAPLVAAVPDSYPWRFRLRAAAGVVAVAEALAARDLTALQAAGTLVAEAVASAPARYARTPGSRLLGRLAAALGALDRDDPLRYDLATVLLGPVAPAVDPQRSPPTGEVAAALRTIGAAALIRLYPAPAHPHRVSMLLVDASTGRLGLSDPVTPDLPAGVPPAGAVDPAWAALVEPLRALPTTGSAPRRVLVAADGAPGRLPLCAIRSGVDGHPASDLVFSYVRSGRQVVELARRASLPVTGDVVFVANPRGDRDLATVEVMTLRRLYHPRSIGLGRTAELVHGAATPADVLAHLPGPAGPGAALLHLGCTLRTTGTPGLELADPGDADGSGDPAGRAVLDVARIAAQAAAAPGQRSGGLAILPTDAGAHHDRWVRFADTLLDAGLTGVIGWLWPVPGPVATLMLSVLHGKLTDEGLPPAMAVHEVHRWMRAPDRGTPPYLPPGTAAALAGTELADPAYWAALCHRGR
ncbi:CHAT domain-containing protein [Micromonospora rifamycinica]|uniref:CHAT domain-containing protein n=1 Tax=Micromonospora rifamycinica TaxID=291594 RepID=UPI0012F81EE2|nr:CHAT domain-containing protein [Micromonospora rifamycinica]